MVEAARRRPGVRAVIGDALELPFRDQLFDVVLANRVLHLVDDPVRVVREIVRVTLPGGTAIAEMWEAGPSPRRLERLTRRLPEHSLLRRYLEVPRRYQVAAFVRTLRSFGCEVTERTLPRNDPSSEGRFLARIARASGTTADLEVAAELERNGSAPRWGPARVVVARLPGPRSGGMPVRVTGLDGLTTGHVRSLIADLPKAHGYEVVVKPLRYRTRPHVQAFCEFDRKRITIQVPVPFHPFVEDVPYRAQRLRAKGLRFRWYRRRLRFERPDELIRYLYLHEYYHWYLREVLGRPSAAETACDRFALQRL
jgi:SAM-dependent methyltransferase